ncbi:MAG: endonuclease/exonuclease/phosphatase family protein, partial [Muribaculaceae bacterium]|nr:endonuclease/exonuclease/phosphatase family protein [Muribaculaceae bacterium]
HPVNQIDELAKRNGFKPYFCKAIDYRGGEYGIGIMSRMEPISTYSGALPGVEPRVFFACEFEDFVFIATHLCVSKADNRTWSYDIINEYVKDNYTNSTKPVFLAGDLNATSLPANCLASWEAISAASPTFYSSSSRIDYVLRWKGNQAPCTVVRTMVPVVEGFSFYNVSDHLPVLVDIEK